MGNQTKIEWTDVTWNPVSGCSKVSAGCKNCYAERVFSRPYPGRKFTDVRIHPDRLDQPLRWRKPRRVFVNSMSDLFHEDVPDEFIDKIFAVMALCPQHTFQILTKRPLRMQNYIDNVQVRARLHRVRIVIDLLDHSRVLGMLRSGYDGGPDWPLHNVWLGVSVEDQETADERIPLLLQTPAAVRFVSAEPLLEEITIFSLDGIIDLVATMRSPLHWVIVGGESGPGARPFDVQWARDIIQQCRGAGVPCFVKQLGANTLGWCFGNCDADGNDCSNEMFKAECQSWEASEGPHCPDGRCVMRMDRKGGFPLEWPLDLRVREFPK